MEYWLRILITLTLVVLDASVSSLEMLEIVGPQLVNMGELVTLLCRYDLGKDTVYSIKWYKDSHEIYRYVPTDQPEFFVFKTKGVNVDGTLTMPNKLVARMEGPHGTGQYRCEVTIETPRFITMETSKNVTVVVPPQIEPSISGMSTYYRPGDLLDVTCRVQEAKPLPHITWKINQKQVPSDMILPSQKSRNRSTGLESIESNLRFTVQESDFLDGHLHISCLASIQDVWKARVNDAAVGVIGNRTQQTNQLVLDSSSSANPTQSMSKAHIQVYILLTAFLRQVFSQNIHTFAPKVKLVATLAFLSLTNIPLSCHL